MKKKFPQFRQLNVRRECKNVRRQLMNNYVFEYFSDLKNGQTKIVDKPYNKFQIQPYLTTK